jgi:hypothetical protein
VLLLALLGAVFGCLGVSSYNAGWFNRWRALPALPEPAAELSGATIDVISVTTAAGQVYQFDLQARERGWQATTEIYDLTDEDCERFAERAPDLSAVVETRLACEDFVEAGTTTVFALRENRRVYYWREESSAYLALLLIVACPSGGALLGLIVGLILVLTRR